MNSLEILEAIGHGEALDWEFKSAKGGVPASLYDTYSAMANTRGGVIVLGVEERDGLFFIDGGVENAAKKRQDIWNCLNNRGKTSANLLVDEDVCTVGIEGKELLVVQVPKAGRRERPVFVGLNPLEGTFRRNNEGDYRCSRDEVGRMLADQEEETADAHILLGFSLDDLDLETLRQFRNRFASRTPDHPWLELDTKEFLQKLGGWRLDRVSGEEGLTTAGLLMFGKGDVITDPNGVPNFHVDYREIETDDPAIRWTDRLYPDGTWHANLYQFYERTYARLTRDLKIPFELRDSTRIDDTLVHQALREALTNSIVHADYRGQGGIVVIRRRQGFELSNPGSLLISYDQLRRGGVSECRNKSIQKMFQMVGRGDKAGSGIDTIVRGWNSQNWRGPTMQESVEPDRVSLYLPTVSFLPPESLARLESLFGKDLNSLSSVEMQILVTAEIEGMVSNSRVQLISDSHPAEITHTLQRLVGGGFLALRGQRRGAYYVLPVGSLKTVGSSSNNVGSSNNNVGTPPHIVEGVVIAGELTTGELARLQKIAYPTGLRQRAKESEMRDAILKVCQERYLTAEQLSLILSRNVQGLRDRFISGLVKEGRLKTRYHMPNHPHQAYITLAETNGDGT